MTEEKENKDLLDNVVVPIVNVNDARKTIRSLRKYNPNNITALYIAEISENYINKKPRDTDKEIAEAVKTKFENAFPDVKFIATTSSSVPDEIISVADDVGATAIVYRPREGNRLTQFLTGDVSLKLVTNSIYPVIALPEAEKEVNYSED